jgi:glycerophosphoryl diester phosphodiesterase
MTQGKKLIVAHRGDRTRAHENTLEAFRDAIELGADMIEFDVRRTADGQLVVHHDAEIGGIAIADLPYTKVVNRAAYTVPLLTEVLDLASGQIQLDVELKETGYERDVLRQILDRAFPGDRFVITSFWPEALEAIGASAQTGLLVEGMTWQQALDRYRQTRANILAPDYRMIAGASDIPLLPWTVNDPDAIRNLLERPPVLGLITDRPREALRLRGNTL